MTLEIDLQRVAEVTARLGRHRSTMETIRGDLDALGRRMQLEPEVAPATSVAERIAEQLALAAMLLNRRAERASRADDERVDRHELRSFAGGTALCSAIQLASPIPSRPATSGASGAIDAAGMARDVAALVDAAPATIAGRAVPAATIVAAITDTVLCRLRVGSGAPISTRTTVDEHGQQIYEGSRSTQKHMDDAGLPLAADLVRRDRQMWNAEHRNPHGYVIEPYPGYPAYDVNAPRG